MSATKLFLQKSVKMLHRYWAYPIVGIPWYLYLELITNLIRSLCLIFVIKNLKYFSQCATYMTGVYRQGIHCQTCGYNSHYRCTKFVPGVCPLPVDDLKKRIGINSVNIQGKDRYIFIFQTITLSTDSYFLVNCIRSLCNFLKILERMNTLWNFIR